jgi:hypothetical protein
MQLDVELALIVAILLHDGDKSFKPECVVPVAGMLLWALGLKRLSRFSIAVNLSLMASRFPYLANHSMLWIILVLWVALGGKRQLPSMMATVYAVAGFHKVNIDFMNPILGCTTNFANRFVKKLTMERLDPLNWNEWQQFAFTYAPYAALLIELGFGGMGMYCRPCGHWQRLWLLVIYMFLHVPTAVIDFFDFGAVAICAIVVSINASPYASAPSTHYPKVSAVFFSAGWYWFPNIAALCLFDKWTKVRGIIYIISSIPTLFMAVRSVFFGVFPPNTLKAGDDEGDDDTASATATAALVVEEEAESSTATSTQGLRCRAAGDKGSQKKKEKDEEIKELKKKKMKTENTAASAAQGYGKAWIGMLSLCAFASGPYVGLHTQGSFTMFSNLKVHGNGTTNHFLIPNVLIWEGSLQADLIQYTELHVPPDIMRKVGKAKRRAKVGVVAPKWHAQIKLAHLMRKKFLLPEGEDMFVKVVPVRAVAGVADEFEVIGEEYILEPAPFWKRVFPFAFHHLPRKSGCSW